MPKRRLHWHLSPSYVFIVAIAVFAIAWLAIHQFERYALRATRNNLQALADVLDQELGPEIFENREAFSTLARRYGAAGDVRVALVLPTGKVDFDTRNRPEEFENQPNRPELSQALAGVGQEFVRYIAALDQRMFYLAVPLFRHDRLAGVFYLSTSLAPLDAELSQLQLQSLLIGILLAVLTPLLAWWVARGLREPLESMRRAMDALARGEWAARVASPEIRGFAEMADAFNHLADQLEQRIRILIRNNNEQKAVLASMAEGVLAVDSQERVISMNTASGRLLGLEQSQAQGRRLQEVVRNADLSRFISRALSCEEPVEADVLLHGDRGRVMQARGSALHDLEGSAIGAVIVLNDVTDFRRLEHIRRDFVANVSHELKTPITSIKGFVETLLDGAMQDPVDSDRFLRIIAKQSDRLHAIIEDLLSLSKIEQSEDADDIALEPALLRPMLESALNTCYAGAQERNIEVVIDSDPQLKAIINSLLLEQAVVNLLDNAIKYSEPGRQVLVSAAEINGEVTISVTDRGCGIANEHLSRIFERFYRVDRARSRKLGGTGLGLAIVKHIIQAHHGRVSVESTLGVGSTFAIHLPQA